MMGWSDTTYWVYFQRLTRTSMMDWSDTTYWVYFQRLTRTSKKRSNLGRFLIMLYLGSINRSTSRGGNYNDDNNIRKSIYRTLYKRDR